MTIHEMIVELVELDEPGCLQVAIADWSEEYAPPTLDFRLKRTRFLTTGADGKDIIVDGVVLTTGGDEWWAKD